MDLFSVETISSVGFPIAMCFYLMFRLEKVVQENTRAIQSLKDFIRAFK